MALGNVNTRRVVSIATISASCVDLETQLCLVDKKDSGMLEPLREGNTTAPLADLWV